MNNKQIDPYKSCKLFYGNDVNNINNCLAETTVAFLGKNYLSDTEIFKKNQEHVFDLVRKRGFPPDAMRPTNAVAFNQVPNYFPSLLEKNDGNIKKSIIECKYLCNNSKNHKNECKKKCDIQGLAVENYDKDKRSHVPPVWTPLPVADEIRSSTDEIGYYRGAPHWNKLRKRPIKCKKVSYDSRADREYISKKNPWGFYISFTIVSLMFAVLIAYFLNGIFIEKF